MFGSSLSAVRAPGSPRPFGLGASARTSGVIETRAQKMPKAATSFQERVMCVLPDRWGEGSISQRHRQCEWVAAGSRPVESARRGWLEACVVSQVSGAFFSAVYEENRVCFALQFSISAWTDQGNRFGYSSNISTCISTSSLLQPVRHASPHVAEVVRLRRGG